MDAYKKAKEALETIESLIKELNIINIEGAIINRKIRISGNLASDLSLQLYNLGVTDEIVKSGKYDNLISNFVKNNGIKDINLEFHNKSKEEVVEESIKDDNYNNMVKEAYLSDMKNRSDKLKEEELKKAITNEDGTLNMDKITNDAFNKDVQILMESKEEVVEEPIKDVDFVSSLKRVEGEVISEEEYDKLLASKSENKLEENTKDSTVVVDLTSNNLEEQIQSNISYEITEPILIGIETKEKEEEVKVPTLEETRKANLQKSSQNYAMNGSALDQLEKTGVYYYRELKNLNTSKIKDPSIGNIVVGIKKATAELKSRLADVNINKFGQKSSPELGMSR